MSPCAGNTKRQTQPASVDLKRERVMRQGHQVASETGKGKKPPRKECSHVDTLTEAVCPIQTGLPGGTAFSVKCLVRILAIQSF